ncbi:MAG: hypothetical protein ACRYF5_16700 [Janthinobacterium lividum]
MTERELVRHVLIHHRQKAIRDEARHLRMQLAKEYRAKYGRDYAPEPAAIGLLPELDIADAWWRMECWRANNTRQQQKSAIERYKNERIST